MTAHAQGAPTRHWEQTAGTIAHHCEAGDRLLVEGAGNLITLTGHCASLTIDGADNVVRSEAIDLITIDGAGNQFDTGALQRVSIEGANNAVVWRSAQTTPPRILKNDGAGNRVVRGR